MFYLDIWKKSVIFRVVEGGQAERVEKINEKKVEKSLEMSDFFRIFTL